MYSKEDVPRVFERILDRRWRQVPGDIREKAFGTRGLLCSYWSKERSLILTLGSSAYQRRLDSNCKAVGTPLPGISVGEDKTGSLFIVNERQVGFSKFTLKSDGRPAVSVGRGGNLFLSEIAVVQLSPVLKVDYEIEIAFVAALGESLTLNIAADDLETELVRQLGSFVSKEPLNAGQ